MQQKLLIASLLALGAVAVPVPDDSPCPETNDYKVTKQNEFDDTPRLVTGYQCTSNADDTCSLTQSATYTKTVTKTVNVGGSFSLDLTKILSAGLDAGFSMSWATSDAQGSSAGVSCPKGGVTCGLQVTTKMVHTEGSVHHVVGGDYEICGSDLADETYDYSVDSAKTVPNTPPNQANVMNFQACLIKCDGDQCQDKDVKSLPPCPT